MMLSELRTVLLWDLSSEAAFQFAQSIQPFASLGIVLDYPVECVVLRFTLRLPVESSREKRERSLRIGKLRIEGVCVKDPARLDASPAVTPAPLPLVKWVRANFACVAHKLLNLQINESSQQVLRSSPQTLTVELLFNPCVVLGFKLSFHNEASRTARVLRIFYGVCDSDAGVESTTYLTRIILPHIAPNAEFHYEFKQSLITLAMFFEFTFGTSTPMPPKITLYS